MNPKNLIQSGLLELYALDLCSPEEKKQVEEAMANDEAVRKEFEEICDALDMLATESAVEVPTSLKEKVMAGLDSDSKTVSEADIEARPVTEIPEKPTVIAQATETTKPASTPTSGGVPVYDLNRWKWMAAASILLLAVSIGMNVKFFSDWQSAEEEVALLQQDKMLLSDENGTLQTKYRILKDQFSFFERDNIQTASLKGTETYPSTEALVFWDKSKGDVFLVANNLPKLGTNEQYQLWAIDNGKPVGAGLIPLNHEAGAAYQMSNVSSSQAFAITIEKEGGAEAPTLEKMVVIATL